MQGAGGVGGLLMVNAGSSGVHFPAYDLNGNVMGLVNAANGNISAKYEYGPFGEVFCSVGDMAKVNPFGFSTKYTDNETDLLYYGYRYYSPALGRWLSRDPIEEQGGLNLYGFVNNDPVNKWDRLGLKFPCCPATANRISVTVAASDAPGSRRIDRIPSGAIVSDFIQGIMKNVRPGECINRLTIIAHGNSDIMAIGGAESPTPWPPGEKKVNADPAIYSKNATRIGKHIKGLCVCDPCYIYLLSCNVGLGDIGQSLANGSGCIVYAPSGYCYPNRDEPGNSKIVPEIPGEKVYPGAGDRFNIFLPKNKIEHNE
ncbi:MAG: RHS repeat-associated core domain-containing protein [Verrucomicrobiae bacterium]|nr:RHS repeat-associated core domain-containing protein [Verrucomicrobiae bacterium]